MNDNMVQHRSPFAYLRAALENRSAPRVKIRIPAKLRLRNSTGFQVEVVDLSLSGFACEPYLAVHPGTLCWLTMPGLASMPAEIVRNDGVMLGCAFHGMLNQAVLDSLVKRYRVPEDEAR
jgi:hypothetical protein